jgi:RNase P/RNase MRP subunit p29
MQNTYTDWMGCQVALQIDVGKSQFPLRGLVVSETGNALRLRIEELWEEECWDVDIFKDMITRVEADKHGAASRTDYDRGTEF